MYKTHTEGAKKCIHILRDVIYVLCIHFLAPSVDYDNLLLNSCLYPVIIIVLIIRRADEGRRDLTSF